MNKDQLINQSHKLRHQDYVDFCYKHKLDLDKKYFRKVYNVTAILGKEIKLTEDMIKFYYNNPNTKDLICWYILSMYAKLSESFILEYEEKLDWDRLSEYQTLSEEFIKFNKDKVNWIFISLKQSMSFNFIIEMKDYINFDYLSANLKIDFIKEFNSIYTNSTIENIKKLINWKMFIYKQPIDITFIRKYKNSLDWHVLFHVIEINKQCKKDYLEIPDDLKKYQFQCNGCYCEYLEDLESMFESIYH